MIAVIGRWLLTLVACAAAVVTGVLALRMLHLVELKSTFEFLATLAVLFPLHLLVVAAAMAGLALLAWWLRGRFAAGVFGSVSMLTAFLALWPSIAMWRLARQENVQLSLRNYLANATHFEVGGPQLERSVEYGKAADGTKLLLDVWLPTKAGDGALRPAVVKLHGGGWIAGRRGQGINWNRWLSEQGYAVFDVEYRLAPLAQWKDEVGDVKCALGFVASNAARYQVDPERISTWGHSAGGNLAMLAAYSMGDPRLPASCDGPLVAVRSVVNFYGPADLTASVKDGAIPEVGDVLMRYVGGSYTQYPDRYRILSPVNHIGAKSSPTITFLGANDRLLPASQALALDRALAKAGVIRETYLLPGSDHSFDANWGGFATQFARAKVGPFLARPR